MKKILKIVLISIFVLIIILLAYNSLVNLSYSRKKHDEYTFMLPKEIEYIDEYKQGILKHDKILNSSVVIYYATYELAKDLVQTYTFYNSDIEKISEEEIEGTNNLYLITKKITYSDNNKTTYMFSYVYDMLDEKQFVISVECENLDDINYFIKKLKKTAKSIILY